MLRQDLDVAAPESEIRNEQGGPLVPCELWIRGVLIG
jgi:hypothetical protein